MILIEVECSISSKGNKEISVLREMFDSPEGSFLRTSCQIGISFIGVESSHIESGKFALKSGCTQFVHHDIFSIEL